MLGTGADKGIKDEMNEGSLLPFFQIFILVMSENIRYPPAAIKNRYMPHLIKPSGPPILKYDSLVIKLAGKLYLSEKFIIFSLIISLHVKKKLIKYLTKDTVKYFINAILVAAHLCHATIFSYFYLRGFLRNSLFKEV